MASASASTDSPGVRRGPPKFAISSARPPAPRPSSKRPPLSTSSDAAAFAITAGGRSGRFATSVKNEMRSVSATSAGISDQVSRKRRW
jgi:hypothetical protein